MTAEKSGDPGNPTGELSSAEPSAPSALATAIVCTVALAAAGGGVLAPADPISRNSTPASAGVAYIVVGAGALIVTTVAVAIATAESRLDLEELFYNAERAAAPQPILSERWTPWLIAAPVIFAVAVVMTSRARLRAMTRGWRVLAGVALAGSAVAGGFSAIEHTVDIGLRSLPAVGQGATGVP